MRKINTLSNSQVEDYLFFMITVEKDIQILKFFTFLYVKITVTLKDKRLWENVTLNWREASLCFLTYFQQDLMP